LTIGSIHLLEFWAGGEYDNAFFYNDGIFAVDAGFGNIFLKDTVTPPYIGIGTRYIIVFIATSSSHTIKFTNWGHLAVNYGTELILDDVRLFRIETNPCITGLDNISASSYTTAFPNPFIDELNITSTGKAIITLYDMTGRKQLQQRFINSITLFTGQLTNGLYTYEVTNNGTSTRGKLIKQ
jgi:hypothetical protein